MLNALIHDLYAQNAALWDILQQLGVSTGQMRDAISKHQAKGDANVPSGILAALGAQEQPGGSTAQGAGAQAQRQENTVAKAA